MILGKSCISSKLLTANLSVITSLFVFKKNVKKTFVYKEPLFIEFLDFHLTTSEVCA
jgi:hypothetical protein